MQGNVSGLTEHRPRKVFESGGSNWVMTNGAPRTAERRAGDGCGRGSSPPSVGVRGYHPGNFSKFYVQNVVLWGKIALCFESKQSAILTQTFGHSQMVL